MAASSSAGFIGRFPYFGMVVAISAVYRGFIAALIGQARLPGHRMMAENWTEKVKEFEHAAEIIRESTRVLNTEFSAAKLRPESCF